MPTGKKPTDIKCKLHIGTSGNVMPLTTYQFLNPSEFNEQGKSIGGYSQNRTILKGYNNNTIQHYKGHL